MKDWKTYFDKNKNAPPSDILKEVIPALKPGRALDFGAGPLNDTKFLLSKGWEVTALDKSPLIEDIEINNPLFHRALDTFEHFSYPKDSYDLINAQWSIPFINPSEFDRIMSELKASLKEGGYLCGQFFGKNDGWKEDKTKTFLEKNEIYSFFEGWKKISVQEKEYDAPTASGEIKHWHVFDIVARK